MSRSDDDHTELTAEATRSSAARLTRSAGDRTALVVYEGDGSGATSRVVELQEGAQFTIGRSRTADLRVDSERVSRIHAKFERRGGDLFVEDVGSRNGTWVNGAVITEPRLLRAGDEVVVGPVTVVVSITSSVVARPRLETTEYLEARLAGEVDRGKRYRRQLSLAMMRIDGSPAEVDDASDRIAAALRPMDVLTEYSPSLLAIVLPELDALTAGATARKLRVIAQSCDGAEAPVTVAVGIATFPEHGTTVGALIARARSAVEAIRTGPAGEIGVPPEDPDPLTSTIVAFDPQMRRAVELAKKVADHPITVLIRGETGVGKELIAGAIHGASKRRDQPFIRLNCASLHESLLESELFGHEKGSFTGADRRKQGYFEAAHKGTLFLDEIGEMSPGLQAKLLRVLETRRITRVGGTDEIEVEVRLVCATHRDLEAEANAGTFRSDLFFRISAFTILVPPLRDRPEQILALAEHFLQQATADSAAGSPWISPSASEALQQYAWPGNVRELRNAIERAVVVHTGGVVELEDLPDHIRDRRVVGEVAAAAAASGRRDVRDQIADLERGAIVAALEASNGNRTQAAKQLGLTRRTLLYRMEKHGLKPLPDSRK